jgi:inosine-uridine nucleoside N-ribohydrolase
MESSTATVNQRHIVAFVDAPDPDNFALIIAACKLNQGADVHVVLTGRPVRFGATKEMQTWEWDPASSLMAQQASALRIKNFLRHWGINVTRVFDGGIAPRTLVPHHIHFAEYYKFFDADPLQSIRYSELEGQDELAKLILSFPEQSVEVLVGGPMTGLHQLVTRCPAVVNRFKEVHAMFATWGNVALMQFDDKPRGALQFNVACDPLAAYTVLKGLPCPVYLMPTEVTRVKEIGFINAQALRAALPDTPGTRALYNLYAVWYDAAVKPRQDKNPDELIFIHDLVAALSLLPAIRDKIYDVVPVRIESVPHLAPESADWGKVIMKKTRKGKCVNRYAATGLKPGGAEEYLKILQQIFA